MGISKPFAAVVTRSAPATRSKGVTKISVAVMGRQNRAVAALTVPFMQRLGSSVLMEEVEDGLFQVWRELSAAIGAHNDHAAA